MSSIMKSIFLLAMLCSGGTFKYKSNAKVGHLNHPVMAIDLDSSAYVWVANPAYKAQTSSDTFPDPYDFTVGKGEAARTRYTYFFSSARLSVASQEATDIRVPRRKRQLGVYHYNQDLNIIQHLFEGRTWMPFNVYKIFKQIVKTFQYLQENHVYLENIQPQNIRISMNGEAMFSTFSKSEAESSLHGQPHTSQEFMVDTSAYFRGVSGKLKGVPKSPCPLFWGPEKCRVDRKSSLGKQLEFDAYQEVVWSLGEILMALTGVVFPEDNTFNPKGSGYPRILNEMREADRNADGASSPVNHAVFSDDFFDLVGKMLVENPAERIKLENILAHTWCTRMEPNEDPSIAPHTTSSMYKYVPPTQAELEKFLTVSAGRWLDEVYETLVRFRSDLPSSHWESKNFASLSSETFAKESLPGKLRVLVKEMVSRFPKSWIAVHGKHARGVQIEVFDEEKQAIVITVRVSMNIMAQKIRVTPLRSRSDTMGQVVDETSNSCSGFARCLRRKQGPDSSEIEQQLQFVKAYNEKILSSFVLRGISLKPVSTSVLP